MTSIRPPNAVPSTTPIVRNVEALRAAVRAWREAGERVGLVPTMGALHEGHLSLVRLARERADHVIASVFVNPTQFAPTEDLDRYPRQEARDAELLAGAGCDLLFAPGPQVMYPPGFCTAISVAGVSDDLEGRFRPQMFGGVATVVAKLLIQAEPHVAVFGEKDYQQVLVIRRLARDLDLPVEIVSGVTVREADGLAMSSRNAYLTPEQRQVAGQLNRILAEAARRARSGARVADIEAGAATEILAAGFDAIDYVEVRGADDLAPFAQVADGPARVLAAVRLGGTRLIDNLAV
jgi:pantoate--beta-alanine ligase